MDKKNTTVTRALAVLRNWFDAVTDPGTMTHEKMVAELNDK